MSRTAAGSTEDKGTLRYGLGSPVRRRDYDSSPSDFPILRSYLVGSHQARLAAESGDTPSSHEVARGPVSDPASAAHSQRICSRLRRLRHPVASLSWSVMTLGVSTKEACTRRLEDEERGDYFHGPASGFGSISKMSRYRAGAGPRIQRTERSTVFTVVIGFHAN